MTMNELERVVSVDEAAALCGVSDDSIRRRLRAGALKSAYVEKGAWRIPVADLVRVGLRPKLFDDDLVPELPSTKTTRSLQTEVVALREQLVRALARASAAEALAAARAEHIADLRAQLGLGPQLRLFPLAPGAADASVSGPFATNGGSAR
jgi:hypothetical protein